MKTGIYFCNCGSNISENIDSEIIKNVTSQMPDVAYFKNCDFLCSDEGEELLKQDIVNEKPDRIVIAACSPRDYESTFMRVLSESGMNPYLMHMVNIREQVAWVTENQDKATQKALAYIKGAVLRVGLQEPLEKKQIDTCPDVVVIGAGPAGLRAALTLAKADRKVTIVEKEPLVGGLPIRFEEVFPSMECSPCMFAPLIEDIFNGDYAHNIDILTLSEVIDVVGYYGNFTVTVKQSPRYVDTDACIGCGECIEQCPVSIKNTYDCDLGERKAISFPTPDAAPDAPFIEPTACLKFKGQDCTLCQEACEVEGAINFNDSPQLIKKDVGAIVVATGASLYDCETIANLGYKKVPDVYTSLEFERILSSSGPREGEIVTSEGNEPQSCAIVHCVGSLDSNHKDYCSGICCSYAFKFSHMISSQLEEAQIYHLYKELSLAGKEEFSLYHHVKDNPNANFIRYNSIDELAVSFKDGKKIIDFKDSSGQKGFIQTDMIILCPALVPGTDAHKLGSLLDINQDSFGFFEELHGRLDTSQSNIKGIYLVGTCQSPMDIQKTMTQAMAVSGHILSELIPGKKVEIVPITASVDTEKCGGCKVCFSVCPYKAISFDSENNVSGVNEALCHGCGTCAAACPAGAITCNHFKNETILAEMEGMLV